MNSVSCGDICTIPKANGPEMIQTADTTDSNRMTIGDREQKARTQHTRVFQRRIRESRTSAYLVEDNLLNATLPAPPGAHQQNARAGILRSERRLKSLAKPARRAEEQVQMEQTPRRGRQVGRKAGRVDIPSHVGAEVTRPCCELVCAGKAKASCSTCWDTARLQLPNAPCSL